jgi:hypothetical protein
MIELIDEQIEITRFIIVLYLFSLFVDFNMYLVNNGYQEIKTDTEIDACYVTYITSLRSIW